MSEDENDLPELAESSDEDDDDDNDDCVSVLHGLIDKCPGPVQQGDDDDGYVTAEDDDEAIGAYNRVKESLIEEALHSVCATGVTMDTKRCVLHDSMTAISIFSNRSHVGNTHDAGKQYDVRKPE